MGQCSTLPSEGRQSRRGGREDESLHRDSRTRKSSGLKVTPLGEFSPMQQQQIRSPKDGMMDDAEPMDIREDIPPPPEIATRTRCYKLNLDSNLYPHHSVYLGPFTDTAPPLTYSLSDDSAENYTPLQVAINTAKIFRGITVGKDGTILSQNARATRSNRGSSKSKVGEKSRQATKIDKAKDLVEETIQTGKAPDSDEPANMQSIVVMGEYDDMKYLVRDGAKKLREAAELEDDSLLNINRGRDENSNSNIMAKISSPRKRGSTSGQRHPGMHTPNKSRQFSPPGVPPKLKGHPRDRPGSSRKDQASARRESRDTANGGSVDRDSNGDSRNDGDWGNNLPVSFSRGFQTIWNCGATGERSDDRMHSPTQQVSDSKTPQPMNDSSGMHQNRAQMSVQSSRKSVFEGRESQQYGETRESGVTSRAN
mmetsp:Transcript_3088/g.6438  ORF Transcript_3088/g.6438 Transcript_3088/m.6438 type:complete len:424 (-) Transcript_3088:131-1402(-)